MLRSTIRMLCSEYGMLTSLQFCCCVSQFFLRQCFNLLIFHHLPIQVVVGYLSIKIIQLTLIHSVFLDFI